MKRLSLRTIDRPARAPWLAALLLSIGPAGCSPEGAGTIKIGDPKAVRAKFEGGKAEAPKAATEKDAKALQLEEEAAKKHPKLH